MTKKLKNGRKKEESEADLHEVNAEDSSASNDKQIPDQSTISPDLDIDDGGPLSV